ncbi:MAG: cupin domain-containing protein [Solirubrobacteraceae bacterium]|nr:cupin domain-containing protein [Solirubrobacteraceae bacterium]
MDQTSADPYEIVRRAGAAPLWQYYGSLFAAQPSSRAVPFIWRYAELRPSMLHFVDALSLEEAERRVLMLVNPELREPPATLSTLYAGLQIIVPGETAQAHRHTSGAFRLIIEGEGACTTVDGERVHMRPGDLLLTPSWHWHDHEDVGTGPMIWLDGLDYPLVNLLEAGFFEVFAERMQPRTMPDDISTRQYIHGQLRPTWETPRGLSSPIGNYPWSETEAAFADIGDDADGSAVDGVMLEYTNPWTGGPVMPTIGCRMQRLPPGFAGVAHRHTSNTIYHVVRGEGRSVVDDVVLEWNEHDVFAVPSWTVHEHHNGSGSEDAIVFSYTDEPVMRSLGLYREQSAAAGR